MSEKIKKYFCKLHPLFITNYDKVITNYYNFAYYKLRRSVVTNYDSFCIITNCDNIITNYDRYYKLRQNIYFISYEIIKTVIFGIQTKQLFGSEEGVRAQLPGTSAYKRLNLM